MHSTGSLQRGKTPRDEITIRLVDNGSDRRPIAVRARQILKLCLRGFGLRCSECTGIDLTEAQP